MSGGTGARWGLGQGVQGPDGDRVCGGQMGMGYRDWGQRGQIGCRRLGCGGQIRGVGLDMGPDNRGGMQGPDRGWGKRNQMGDWGMGARQGWEQGPDGEWRPNGDHHDGGARWGARVYTVK